MLFLKHPSVFPCRKRPSKIIVTGSNDMDMVYICFILGKKTIHIYSMVILISHVVSSKLQNCEYF